MHGVRSSANFMQGVTPVPTASQKWQQQQQQQSWQQVPLCQNKRSLRDATRVFHRISGRRTGAPLQPIGIIWTWKIHWPTQTSMVKACSQQKLQRRKQSHQWTRQALEQVLVWFTPIFLLRHAMCGLTYVCFCQSFCFDFMMFSLGT